MEKAEYQNRTGDERLETFSFASKLIPQSGSGGTRTPDQFIRSELLYPSELLTQGNYSNSLVLAGQDLGYQYPLLLVQSTL